LAADGDDRSGVVRVQVEVWPDGPRPIDEQLNCRKGHKLVEWNLEFRGRTWQRRDRVDALGEEAEPGATCDEKRECWQLQQQLGQQGGAGRDLLEIVQNQQHMKVDQGRRYLIPQWLVTKWAEAVLLADGHEYAISMTN
jgi:hypothetical protein